MTKDKTGKTELDYLKEIAHFTRSTANNLQFFFYLGIISGVLGVMFRVMSTVNAISQ